MVEAITARVNYVARKLGQIAAIGTIVNGTIIIVHPYHQFDAVIGTLNIIAGYIAIFCF